MSFDVPLKERLSFGVMQMTQCDQTLDAIAQDTQFVDNVAAIGFTSVEYISDGANYGVTSSERRSIERRNQSRSLRKHESASLRGLPGAEAERAD
jgi:hypothetical protein